MEAPGGPSSLAANGLRRKKRKGKKKPPSTAALNPSEVPVEIDAKVPHKVTEASSNWKALKKTLEATHDPRAGWRSRTGRSDRSSSTSPTKGTSRTVSPTAQAHGSQKRNISPTKTQSNGQSAYPRKDGASYLALDCEMVGVGPMKETALARVSIVDEKGICVYDKFVKPLAPVTDYRTEFSGVREENLRSALNFHMATAEVASILKGQIVVGHAVQHDFRALMLQHPNHMTRDTSEYFRKLNKTRTPSLKKLAKDYLNMTIQSGEHDSVEDARVTMKLYLKFQAQWEASLKKSRADTILRSREKQQLKPANNTTD